MLRCQKKFQTSVQSQPVAGGREPSRGVGIACVGAGAGAESQSPVKGAAAEKKGVKKV
jgi:hypothetical protein